MNIHILRDGQQYVLSTNEIQRFIFSPGDDIQIVDIASQTHLEVRGNDIVLVAPGQEIVLPNLAALLGASMVSFRFNEVLLTSLDGQKIDTATTAEAHAASAPSGEATAQATDTGNAPENLLQTDPPAAGQNNLLEAILARQNIELSATGLSQAGLDVSSGEVSIGFTTASQATTNNSTSLPPFVNPSVGKAFDSVPLIAATAVDTTSPNVTITSALLVNSATPVVSGTAEAGSTVTLIIGGARYVTVATDGVWRIDTASATPTQGSLHLNANGDNVLSVSATDHAGNSTTVDQQLTVDTSAPLAPNALNASDDVAGGITGTIAVDGLTNDARPTFSGQAEAGATVTLRDGSVDLGSTTADATGAWNFTPTHALADGQHSVTAFATDAAGNTSTSTQALSFLIDARAPTLLDQSMNYAENSSLATVLGSVQTQDNQGIVHFHFAATGTSLSADGFFQIDDAGQLRLTQNGANSLNSLANDFEASTTHAFSYAIVASDAAGNHGTATITLNLQDVVNESHSPLSLSFGAGVQIVDGGQFVEQAVGMSVRADGQVIVGGTSDFGENQDSLVLMQLNPDGSLDTSFADHGVQISAAPNGDLVPHVAFTLDANGQAVFAGRDYMSGLASVARFNTTGSSFDNSLDGDGAAVVGLDNGNAIGNVAVDAQGHILVAGASEDQASLIRLSPQGSLDATLNGDGDTDGVIRYDLGGPSQANDLLLASDGSIVLGGLVNNASDADFMLLGLNADGSRDETFGAPGAHGLVQINFGDFGQDTIAQLLRQTDGKIVAAGRGGNYDVGDFALLRVNADGSIDTNFGQNHDGKVQVDIGANGADDGANAVLQAADGSLFVAGYTVNAQGNKDFALIHLLADGTLDTNFGVNGKVVLDFFGADDEIRQLALQNLGSADAPDYRLLVAGSVTQANGNQDLAIARFNLDGSLDKNFNPAATDATSFSSPALLAPTFTLRDSDGSSTAGFHLTIARHGGADSGDHFSALAGGTLEALIEGQTLTLDGVSLGTVTQNHGGILALTFASQLSIDQINAALRQIAFQSTATSGLESIQFDWRIVDAQERESLTTHTFYDGVAPNVADQTFVYAENSTSDTILATMSASDNNPDSTLHFVFQATNTAISADGFFQIDNAGHIRLTALGAQSSINDFETSPAAHTYGLLVRDNAGNTALANVTLQVGDVASEAVSFTGQAADYTLHWNGGLLTVDDHNLQNGDDGHHFFGLPDSLQFNDLSLSSYRPLLVDQASNLKTAALSDGGWVTAWQASDGSGNGIFMQHYDAAGQAIGDEVRVNTVSSGNQSNPSLLALADGGWVLAWQSPDGSGNGIFMQHYDAAGQALGDQSRINTNASGEQNNPSLTALFDGGWLLSWQSSGGFFVQHYDAEGLAVGQQALFRPNGINPSALSLMALDDGGWLAVWKTSTLQDFVGDGNHPTFHMQRYDAEGAAVGSEMLPTMPIFSPSALMHTTALADGGWLVTDNAGFAQRYDAEGLAVGEPTIFENQTSPSATATALTDGGWVFAWQAPDASGQGIFMQHYDADGQAVGSETQVNIDVVGDQSNPSLTSLADGGWLVGWSDSLGGHLQRFNADGLPMQDTPHTHYGTVGDDIFTLGLADIGQLAQSGLEGAHFFGGQGSDTLQFDHTDNAAGLTLDLTKIDSTCLLSFEKIDMLSGNAGNANDTLILSISDVLNINDAHQLVVVGDAHDSLHLATGPGAWQKDAQQTVVDGQNFDVYHNVADAQGGGHAQVLVSPTIQVFNDDPHPIIAV